MKRERTKYHAVPDNRMMEDDDPELDMPSAGGLSSTSSGRSAATLSSEINAAFAELFGAPSLLPTKPSTNPATAAAAPVSKPSFPASTEPSLPNVNIHLSSGLGKKRREKVLARHERLVSRLTLPGELARTKAAERQRKKDGLDMRTVAQAIIMDELEKKRNGNNLENETRKETAGLKPGVKKIHDTKYQPISLVLLLFSSKFSL